MKKMNIGKRLGRRLLVAVLVITMSTIFMPGMAFAARPADPPSSPITEADVGDCSEIDTGVAHHGSTGVASCIAALKHTRTQLIALISDLDDFKTNNPGYDWGTDGDDPERIIEELYGRYKDYYDALRGYYEANDEIGAATNWDEYTAAIAKRTAMFDKISGEESDLLKEFVEGKDSLQDAIVAALRPTPAPATSLDDIYLYSDEARPSLPAVEFKDAGAVVDGSCAWAAGTDVTSGIKTIVFTPDDITTYKTGKVAVTFVVLDRTGLAKDLGDARAKLLQIEGRVGIDIIWEAYTIFTRAIEDAQAVANKSAAENRSQTAIDNARAELQRAMAADGINPKAVAESTGPGITAPPVPNVVKIRTPLKTVYLTKNKTYAIPYVFDTLKSKAIKDSGLKITSSKPKIAKIVKSGATYKIKALKKGTTVVTIKTQNGKTAKIKVVVQTKQVALKAFTVKTPKTLKKGKTYQLQITKRTKKASNIATVTFKSSNKKVATVDKAGKITALKKGKVKITIKVGSKKVVRTITIK